MKLTTLSLTGIAALLCFSGFQVQAQQNLPIACAGYEVPKTKLLGQRAGKKLQKAYEAYSDQELTETQRSQQALALLAEIEPKEDYDIAYIKYFRGQLLAQEDGRGEESLKLLREAADATVLNDKDQVILLKLVADLSTREEKFKQAISYYQKWLDTTCKHDSDVYTRMAKAYLETKDYDKVIEASDNAIKYNKKGPDKNPYVLKVSAFNEKKDYPNAIKVVITLVELFPEESMWWSRLGFMYMMVEDYKKALSTFSLAYKMGLLEKKVEYNAYIQLLAANDVPYRSAELHVKYINEGILNKEAKDYAKLANTFQLARDYKQSAKYYGVAGDMSKDSEYFRKQGVLLMTAQDYRNAIVALNKALEAGIKSPGKVYFSLMEANFYAGNFRTAYENAKEARKDRSIRKNVDAWMPYIKEKAKNRGIKI